MNFGTLVGKLVGVSIKQACNDTGKKPKQVGRVTMYSKPGKKPMPQPGYVKQANPFLSLMAMDDDMASQEPKARRSSSPKVAPAAKKMTARGPIRGTKPMRSEPKLRMRKRPIITEED